MGCSSIHEPRYAIAKGQLRRHKLVGVFDNHLAFIIMGQIVNNRFCQLVNWCRDTVDASFKLWTVGQNRFRDDQRTVWGGKSKAGKRIIIPRSGHIQGYLGAIQKSRTRLVKNERVLLSAKYISTP